MFSGEKWLVACLAAAVCMARPAYADPVVVTVGTHSLIMKDNALFPASRKFSFNVRIKRSATPLPSGSRTKLGELVMPRKASSSWKSSLM